MPQPFAGVRVIDLSDRLSGAFAARLFGDLGAEVVLAEPRGGHALRHEPPFLDDEPGPERSVLHAYANWNKRSLVVPDEAALCALLAEADVVITTRSPVSTLPLAAALDALPPTAVHLSVTAHGLDGPLAAVPGNNLTASARTGWAYINGYVDEPPLQMPARQSGYVGGVAGFVAAAAALSERDRTGRGGLVDVSELEAFALTCHPWGIAAIFQARGWTPGPGGGRRRGMPGPLYETADGQINFGFGDWHNWTQAMELLELPELAHDERLIPDRGRHSQDMAPVVAGVARSVHTRPRWPLFHALAGLRCISGCVQDMADLLADPQLATREFFVETEVAGRRVRASGAPAKLSPAPWRLVRPAPRLDEAAGQLPSPARATAGAPRVAGGASAGERSPSGPLAGVRVLAFTGAWSGTFGTELLAFLGADVVQVEALHRSDVWRNVGSAVPEGVADPSRRQHPLNTQGLFNSVNLNKRGLTLDMRQERGRELFWGLVPRFDILAENFRPTVMPNWGVTLETLHAKCPGMIWASISGYGTAGPHAAYPANGATTEPMSGLSSLHGYEGDLGKNTGGLYPDPVSGYFFAASVIAALRHRDRTGEPQRIDLAMNEAVAAMLGDAVIEYDSTGRVPRPQGNHHPRIAPHNIYAARDGQWLALAADDDAAWAALAAHIASHGGEARLADDPRFATMAARKAHEPDLDGLLAAWCATQDAAAAEAALGACGVAAARVVSLYDAYDEPNPNFTARDFVVPVTHPESGVNMLPGAPWKIDGVRPGPLRPAPGVGEHSREVLREELAITDEEYDALVASGTTGTLYESA